MQLTPNSRVNEARRELHTRLLARLAAGGRRRSWMLIAMTAPAMGVLGLIVYRFLAGTA